MEVRRVEGTDLVENCVYNIYQTDRNVNVGVCLVISENNRNNRNNIKLRKLIGNNELSLNKSEIYGKRPVDLTGANLRGADLRGAYLSDANLTGADLNNANLTGAVLTDSNFLGAVLRGAVLRCANLRGANLTRVNLYLSNLTDANLIGVILTDSELPDADLTDAIISRNSLSQYQIDNIFGRPKYIEDLSEEEIRQEQRRQEQRRQELLGQQIRNLNNNSNSNNYISQLQRLSNQELVELVIRRPIQNRNNYNHYISEVRRLPREQLIRLLTLRQQRAILGPPVQRVLSFNNIPPQNQQIQRETPITIPENLLNPVKNSNNSCPNFNGLYEFIMRQNLSGIFFFYI